MRIPAGRSCRASQNVILYRSGTNPHWREQRRNRSDRCQPRSPWRSTSPSTRTWFEGFSPTISLKIGSPLTIRQTHVAQMASIGSIETISPFTEMDVLDVYYVVGFGVMGWVPALDDSQAQS